MQSYYFVDQNSASHKLPFNIVRHSYNKGETCFYFHNHSPLEIILVIDGGLEVRAEKKKYSLKKGDICLFNAYESHSGEVSAQTNSTEYLVFTAVLEKCLSFPESTFPQNLHKLLKGETYFENYYSAESSSAKELKAELTALNDMMNLGNSIDYALKKFACCYKVLGLLFEKHYKEVEKKSVSFKRNNNFMRKVTEFVSENYTKENISSALLAKEFYMSVDHFCHIFRRHYGTAFISYLCYYRINQAITLYKGSDLSVGDIARAVGFSDYSYFSRCFKKQIGISPARYFGRWKT